jgi:hypothetical protein
MTVVRVLGIAAFCIFFPWNLWALTVSPVKFTLTLEPGETREEKIILFNETEHPLELEGDVSNITFAPGEKGVPVPAGIFGTDTLANWIRVVDKKVTVQPGERKEVPFRIALPKEAKAGGYYAQIAWSPVVQAGSEIKAVEKIASLILLRVEGDIRESASLDFFGGVRARTRFEKMPIPFSVRIHNDGTVHIAPTGEIRIMDAYGTTVERIPFNQGDQVAYILPDEVRSFDAEWKGGFRFGTYTAVLDVMYGESLQELHGEYTFLIVPTYLLFAWLLVSVLIIILCFGLLKKCISLSRPRV